MPFFAAADNWYRKYENKHLWKWKLTKLISKKKKSEISKSIENKSIETKAYVTPWICLPVKNQPLNLAKKHFGKFNMNFADQGHLGDETDLLIGMDCYWRFMTGKVQQLHEFRNLVMLESDFWMDS